MIGGRDQVPLVTWRKLDERIPVSPHEFEKVAKQKLIEDDIEPTQEAIESKSLELRTQWRAARMADAIQQAQRDYEIIGKWLEQQGEDDD